LHWLACDRGLTNAFADKNVTPTAVGKRFVFRRANLIIVDVVGSAQG